MKYFYISKENPETKKEITQKEAIALLEGNYRDPEYVLENAKTLFRRRIGLTFGEIEIE